MITEPHLELLGLVYVIYNNVATQTVLTSCLDRKRRERWIESVEGIDFTHSSRKAWKTFNRRTGRYESPRQCPITANAIAHQLLANGRYAGASKAHSLNVKQQCSALWKSPGVEGHLASPFTSEELAHAIKLLKCGKAQGPDNIPLEFLKHLGRNCLSWLREFYSSCLNRVATPKIWRKATVTAVPSRTSQWTIPGATGQFRFSVFRTYYLNASFCFDLSLLSTPSCRPNKVAFE